MKRKIYLMAEPSDLGVRFQASDNSMHGYWAGGGEHNPKWVLQSLAKLYGIEEAKEIYTKYNEALLFLKTMNEEKYGGPTGCITLYCKGDNNDIPVQAESGKVG